MASEHTGRLEVRRSGLGKKLSEQSEHLLQEIQLQRFLNEQSVQTFKGLRELRRNSESCGLEHRENAPEQNAISEQPTLEFSDEIKVLPDQKALCTCIKLKIHRSHLQKEMRAEADQKRAPATGWQLGLNDRIAMSKHLFEGNSSDLMRVCSQLESFEKIEEAREFILGVVQADYDWSEARSMWTRLLELTEAHYQHRKR